jgi:hypothetical protein
MIYNLTDPILIYLFAIVIIIIISLHHINHINNLECKIFKLSQQIAEERKLNRDELNKCFENKINLSESLATCINEIQNIHDIVLKIRKTYDTNIVNIYDHINLTNENIRKFVEDELQVIISVNNAKTNFFDNELKKILGDINDLYSKNKLNNEKILELNDELIKKETHIIKTNNCLNRCINRISSGLNQCVDWINNNNDFIINHISNPLIKIWYPDFELPNAYKIISNPNDIVPNTTTSLLHISVNDDWGNINDISFMIHDFIVSLVIDVTASKYGYVNELIINKLPKNLLRLQIISQPLNINGCICPATTIVLPDKLPTTIVQLKLECNLKHLPNIDDCLYLK